MEEAKQIVQDIKKGKLRTVYFLMGDEPFYIDKIADLLEKNLLKEEEKPFNQWICYGKETTVAEVVAHAKRYPMVAKRQLIILKEAQDLAQTIEKLATYAKNPQPTTVLVICYKYKKIDKRKQLYKTISQNGGIVFESKKRYENQVYSWIAKIFKAANHPVSPKAIQLLVDYLGTDLSKIDNEIKKLKLNLKAGESISASLIEENIGISKDFNNFELRKALGSKDAFKAYRILQYFAQNPKKNPLVVTLSVVFGFFLQLLQYHGLSDKSTTNVASVLKINPYFVKDYTVAARNYPMKKVSQIISWLREADLKGKGVGALRTAEADILKELVAKILN